MENEGRFPSLCCEDGAGEQEVELKLKNLNNYNVYKIWKEHMERADYFPPRRRQEGQNDTDRTFKALLLRSLTDDVAKTVANCSAFDMWQELENKFCEYSQEHKYLPLYKAALSGDWEMAAEILREEQGAEEGQVAFTLETALHAAVSSGKCDCFVYNLVAGMSGAALAMTDINGYNALHTAALTGNLYAARILTKKQPGLLSMRCNKGRFPVHVAADMAHRQTLEFLITAMKDYKWINNDDRRQDNSEKALLLLTFMIDAEYFDMALDFLEKNPDLARKKFHDCIPALTTIANRDTVFSIKLNWWEHLKYSMYREKKIHEKKLKREAAVKLVKRLCRHMKSFTAEGAKAIYESALLSAASLGIHEIVEEILDTFPTAIYAKQPRTHQNFLHLAVKNRCERVFNLMYRPGNHRYQYVNERDASNNSILHLAAALAPPHKLNQVSGAALQMQRELQWFKEVAKFVSPYNRQLKNSGDRDKKIEPRTPDMIFTDEHKELKKEGEKWMKDTATSCTIAAALIVTVVFAAAITVPGGNDSTGIPMKGKSTAFTVFAFSDAVSLFSSTTSLLMFLSILTSRYAEEDFLYALPRRLCIGLVTLFLSILSMMVAFGSTVYIVFGRKHTWTLALVGMAALVPISSFMLLQFPLLTAVISSTFGCGIFGKESVMGTPHDGLDPKNVTGIFSAYLDLHLEDKVTFAASGNDMTRTTINDVLGPKKKLVGTHLPKVDKGKKPMEETNTVDKGKKPMEETNTVDKGKKPMEETNTGEGTSYS